MISFRVCLLLWSAPLILLPFVASISAEDVCSILAFFKNENELLRQRKHAENLAAYTYSIHVTEANRLAMIDIAVKNAAASKDLAKRIFQGNYDKVRNKFIARQAKKLGNLGFSVLPEEDYKALQNAISSMQSNYATATVCAYQNDSICGLTLEPHIQERLSNSRDHNELAHYWTKWHDIAGTPMRAHFATYVRLSRKASLMNNLRSHAEYWIEDYEDPDFEANLDRTFQKILPFYSEIHGYVRFKLVQKYPGIVKPCGSIPMHLLGNMWGQSWENVIDLFKPFPDKPFVDVTNEMVRQGINVRRFFELGDDFFKSLNMRPLPDVFWNASVLERPADRPIICHASAWDLYQDSDVRIKMCTEVNTEYLEIVHHELGHIQYYLQYEKQPTVFRDAPNPGFHEAVGDVIALSVGSPKHLQRIGLVPNAKLDKESRINELFLEVVKKVVILPFAYTLDKWRYAVFRGEIDPSVWNCVFWKMRYAYTGLEPPVRRTDLDFDPPAKYHVAADVEYFRYFAAHIFQFQFHKALCKKAGQYRRYSVHLTLDNCDIYNSKKAGQLFSKFLALGASKHWKAALMEFTGETTMDPAAMLEYFEPLRVWLRREIRRLRIPLGWNPTNKIAPHCCPQNANK